MTDDKQTFSEPMPLDPEAQELLAAYRESRCLPPSVKARVRQRLLVAGAPVTLGRVVDRAPPPVAANGVDRRWWLAVAAAIIVLGTAALALLSGGQEGIVATRRGVDGAAYTAEREGQRGGAKIRGGDPLNIARPDLSVAPAPSSTVRRAPTLGLS